MAAIAVLVAAELTVGAVGGAIAHDDDGNHTDETEHDGAADTNETNETEDTETAGTNETDGAEDDGFAENETETGAEDAGGEGGGDTNGGGEGGGDTGGSGPGFGLVVALLAVVVATPVVAHRHRYRVGPAVRRGSQPPGRRPAAAFETTSS